MDDVEIIPNCDWSTTLNVTDADGNAYNLTGKTVTAKLSIRGTATSITATVTNAAGGIVALSALAAVTTNLAANRWGELKVYADSIAIGVFVIRTGARKS